MNVQIGDDDEVLALLRAQRSPENWVVYRVMLYRSHNPEPTHGGCDNCRFCVLQPTVHFTGRDLRALIILTNGPIARLTVLTTDGLDLPRPAKQWLATLFNLAEATNARIDGWIAYDGRG